MQPSCAEEAETTAQGEADYEAEMADVAAGAEQDEGATELEAQVLKVRTLRDKQEACRKSLSASYEKWKKDNSEAIEAAEANRCALGKAEDKLRELTLAAYALDPANKKPAKGVGIRVLKTVEYDPLEARRWAARKGACLALDMKAFEAAVLKGIFDDAPGRVVEKAQATIARDL